MLANSAVTVLAVLGAMGGVQSASVNLADPNALGLAASRAAANLVQTFNRSTLGEGTWNQTSVSWFQSGQMWGAILDHSLYTGDRRSDTLAAMALGNASFNQVGDLLGGSMRTIQEKLLGKWNDDILWWALSMLSATDIYGVEAKMPNGQKFVDVAITTWNEVVEQWDTSCGGGVWWSRDRENPRTATYKASISNSQWMALGGWLTSLTGNDTYVAWSDTTYQWMKMIGVLTPDWHVLDGGSAPECTGESIDRTEWTYNSGLMMYALSYMFGATGKQSYMDDAAKILDVFISTFTNEAGQIAERCEAAGECRRDTPAMKAYSVKALATLFQKTKDATTRSKVQQIIDANFQSMVASCSDDWWCSHIWTGGASPARDVYNQYPAVSLFNAASAIHGASAESSLGELSDTSSSAPPSGSSPTGVGKSTNGVVTGYGSLWGTALAVVIVTVVRRKF